MQEQAAAEKSSTPRTLSPEEVAKITRPTAEEEARREIADIQAAVKWCEANAPTCPQGALVARHLMNFVGRSDGQGNVLPMIDPNSPGGHHVDYRHNTFWIGFRFLTMDLEGARAFVKSADWQIWNLYRELEKSKSIRERITTAPGKAMAAMGNMMRNLRGGR